MPEGFVRTPNDIANTGKRIRSNTGEASVDGATVTTHEHFFRLSERDRKLLETISQTSQQQLAATIMLLNLVSTKKTIALEDVAAVADSF